MSAPTRGQLRVLKALHTEASAHGYAPTIRELCDTLGVSGTNCVAEHLTGLERRGLVEHRPGAARTLRVTRQGLECLLEVANG